MNFISKLLGSVRITGIQKAYIFSCFLPIRRPGSALAWGSSHMRENHLATQNVPICSLCSPYSHVIVNKEPCLTGGQGRRERDGARATISLQKDIHWSPWLKHSRTLSNLTRWITRNLQKRAIDRSYILFSRQKIAGLLFLLIYLLPSACFSGSVPIGMSFPPRYMVGVFLGKELSLRKLN